MKQLHFILFTFFLAVPGLVPGVVQAQTVTPGPQVAQGGALLRSLIAQMQIPANLAVMQQEGIAHGMTLDTELLDAQGGDGWAQQVARIYDLTRMTEIFTTRLERELPPDALQPAMAFFGSDLGRRIVALELSARKALLDDAASDAADQLRDEMMARKDPRADLLAQFIDANELVEQNVAGAMNANYAFYRGMADSGGLPGAMSEQDIIADVWSQEESTRTDTGKWLYSYLGLAYQPLTADELMAYISFSQLPKAQVLNRAMFAAFDEMLTGISRELGLAVGRMKAGQSL